VKAVDGTSIPVFEGSVNQNLFVVLYHKNHLGIMSAQALVYAGDTYSYDFTTGPGQAYGIAGQKEISTGVYGMYSGDGNGNGVVDDTDKSLWSVSAGARGYEGADFDLNGQINNLDKNDKWQVNYNATSSVPD
jgi:hypothetical protein